MAYAPSHLTIKLDEFALAESDGWKSFIVEPFIVEIAFTSVDDWHVSVIEAPSYRAGLPSTDRQLDFSTTFGKFLRCFIEQECADLVEERIALEIGEMAA